ncbi:unnamed protein product, partial [Amoebophrya sp. A25]
DCATPSPNVAKRDANSGTAGTTAPAARQNTSSGGAMFGSGLSGAETDQQAHMKNVSSSASSVSF